jgi:hypothetical protein
MHSPKWDLRLAVKALNMVLGSVGLSLKGVRARKQSNGVRGLKTAGYRLDSSEKVWKWL